MMFVIKIFGNAPEELEIEQIQNEMLAKIRPSRQMSRYNSKRTSIHFALPRLFKDELILAGRD